MKSIESLISRIRPDVTDSLDTTTQLETLGYNRYRVKRDFKLKTTFELGRDLFRIMPKRSFLPNLQPSSSPLLRQLLIFVGLVLTFIASPKIWPLMVLLVWSLISHPLLEQARAEERKTFARLFTIIFISGLLLIILSNVLAPIDLQTNALLLFWWNLGLSLWRPPKIYWRLLLILLGVLSLVSPALATIGLLAFSLMFIPALRSPKASTLKYLNDHLWMLLPTIFYALGIAYLLGNLMTSSKLWLGFLVLTTIFFLSEWLERSLIYSLQKFLWSSHSREDYHAKIFSSLGFWGQILLVLGFVAVLLVLKFFNLSLHPLLPFALLGWTMGLGLILLRLEQLFLVATGFAVAALVVFLGFPFWLVMLGLVLIFLTGMMLIIMRVEGSSTSIF